MYTVIYLLALKEAPSRDKWAPVAAFPKPSPLPILGRVADKVLVKPDRFQSPHIKLPVITTRKEHLVGHDRTFFTFSLYLSGKLL